MFKKKSTFQNIEFYWEKMNENYLFLYRRISASFVFILILQFKKKSPDINISYQSFS